MLKYFHLNSGLFNWLARCIPKKCLKLGKSTILLILITGQTICYFFIFLTIFPVHSVGLTQEEWLPNTCVRGLFDPCGPWRNNSLGRVGWVGFLLVGLPIVLLCHTTSLSEAPRMPIELQLELTRQRHENRLYIHSRLSRSFTARGFSSRDPTRIFAWS